MVRPLGANITINISASSYDLYIAEIKKTFVMEPFDRTEFQHDRLRSAPNLKGQKALTATLLGNTPCQIIIGPVGSTISFGDAIPLNPDVTITSTNFQNIKRRWDITRYTIQGLPTLAASVDAIQARFVVDTGKLTRLQAHVAKAASMETEYLELIALQGASSTFTDLSSTGVSASGNSLGGTVSNILITSFEPSVDVEEIIDEYGTCRLLKSFSMTFETRVNSPLDG
jgi:hypothetical protein